MKYLYEETNYTANIAYLNNIFIYEYDISKCNINVLRAKGYIDKETYEFLYNAEKMVRQVYVGKLLRDNPELNKVLDQGITEARKTLFEANDVQERDVLSIKKDAVFLINKPLQFTEFGLIKFILKNTYTAFYRINNLEFYYYYNSITKDEALSVKGIGKSLNLHEGYFLQILKDLMYSLQVNGVDITMRMLKDFYMEYITLQLPVGYYRTFNPDSVYKFKCVTPLGTRFSTDSVGESDKEILDINYNLLILLQFQRILSLMYFTKH